MTLFRTTCAALAIGLLAACAGTPALTGKDSTEFPGLRQVSSSGFDEAWAKPEAGLNSYTVIAATPLVSADAKIVQPGGTLNSAIQKEWELTPERQEALAQAWSRSLATAAGERSLDMSGAGEQVLRIDASMTRIAPSADFSQVDRTPGRATVYTEDSGEAAIEFRLYDNASGELLAVIRDKQRVGSQMWARSNSITASADVRNLYNGWARRLLDRVSAS